MKQLVVKRCKEIIDEYQIGTTFTTWNILYKWKEKKWKTVPTAIELGRIMMYMDNCTKTGNKIRQTKNSNDPLIEYVRI